MAGTRAVSQWECGGACELPHNTTQQAKMAGSCIPARPHNQALTLAVLCSCNEATHRTSHAANANGSQKRMQHLTLTRCVCSSSSTTGTRMVAASWWPRASDSSGNASSSAAATLQSPFTAATASSRKAPCSCCQQSVPTCSTTCVSTGQVDGSDYQGTISSDMCPSITSVVETQKRRLVGLQRC